MKSNKLAVICTIIALLLMSCKHSDDSSIPQDQADLNKNLELWDNSNRSNYTYTYRKSCFCPPVEDLVITVTNNVVTKAFYTPSGTYLTGEEIQLLRTVEDFFAVIQDAITKKVASLNVTYNKEFGYPERISIDVDERMADEEVMYILSNLQ